MADVVDPHRLAVVRQHLNPERLGSIIDTYVRNGEALMEDMAAAFDAGDLDGVRRAAHTMGTSAGLLGARPLQQALAGLEGQAIRGTWPASDAVAHAAGLFARSVAELQRVDTRSAEVARPAASATD